LHSLDPSSRNTKPSGRWTSHVRPTCNHRARPSPSLTHVSQGMSLPWLWILVMVICSLRIHGQHSYNTKSASSRSKANANHERPRCNCMGRKQPAFGRNTTSSCFLTTQTPSGQAQQNNHVKYAPQRHLPLQTAPKPYPPAKLPRSCRAASRCSPGTTPMKSLNLRTGLWTWK